MLLGNITHLLSRLPVGTPPSYWISFESLVELIDVLAWPITMLLVVWAFRKTLSKLPKRITRLTFPGGSVRLSELEDKIERGQELDQELRHALLLISQEQYQMARFAIEKAIERHPNVPELPIQLANAISFAAEKNAKPETIDLEALADAICVLDGVIAQNPECGHALYNLACLKSVYLKSERARSTPESPRYDTQNVLDTLERAIAADPTSRDYARTDPDFDHLRDDTGFRFLIEKN